MTRLPPPGWYPDAHNPGQEQRWDGEHWMEERRPLGEASLTPEYRQAALDGRVQDLVREGWRIESRSDFEVVISKGSRPNHLLHLILSIVTLGLWLIVWLILALTSHESRRLITVDTQGEVHVEGA